jgi:hypothetical protein
MCELDHESPSDAIVEAGPRRRDLLAAALLSPLGIMLPGQGRALSAPARAAQARTAGVVRTALHVHSSFSEGSGVLRKLNGSAAFASMHGQVDVLQSLGADLCFFTDHDHIVNLEGGGLTPSAFPTVEDFRTPQWTYAADKQGSPVAGRVNLTAQGLDATITAGATRGAHLLLADSSATDRSLRATVADLSVAVTLTPRATSGWAELRFRLSGHPAVGGRAAGVYEVHYRLTPGVATRSVSRSDLVAVVVVPVVVGVQQTIVVSPADDLLAAFADLGVLARDNGLLSLMVGVGAPASATGSVLVRSLELRRGTDAPGRLALQHAIAEELRRRYPEMGVGQGLELSYANHLNWYPTDPATLTILRPINGQDVAPYLQALTAAVIASGGLASYNHPFGTTSGTLLTGSEYTTVLKRTAATLLGAGAYGAALLEVGYELRGRMDVRAHLALWDILLSAGLELRATGVSDDHAGTQKSWTDSNRFFTDVISSSAKPSTVVPLLAQGRSFVSRRPGYDGLLDLASDEAVMGGRRSARGPSAEILLTADALPTGGSLRVVQMSVHGDRTRTTATPPLWEKTFKPGRLVGGTTGVTVANVDSYVRTEVRDGSGTIVAFSNPMQLSPPA